MQYLVSIYLALCIFLSPTAISAQERVALIVGNADYRHERLLRTPRNDGTAMAEALEELGFDVTLALDLDERTFGEALAAYEVKAAKADISVFYYSGHGTEIGGTNYLIPVDAQLRTEIDAKFQAIELDHILDATGAAQTLSLVILDACRNNLFGQGKGDEFGGMSAVAPLPGQVIGYSTAPNSLAFESNGELSPYTQALLERLAADADEDVRIMLSSLTKKTQEYAGRKQVPYVEIGSFPEGHLSLAKEEPPANEAVVLAHSAQNSTAATLPKARPVDQSFADWTELRLTLAREAEHVNLDIPEAHKDVWKSSVTLKDVTVEQDSEYTLRFRAKADDPREFLFFMGYKETDDSSDWKSVAWHKFDLETQWNDFEFVFTSPASTDRAVMAFQFGKSATNVAFSDVTFEAGPPAIVTAPEKPKLRVTDFPRIKDCDECPELVSLPGGTFLRGASDQDKNRLENEFPQSQVTVEPFAIGVHEVTVEEFSAFAQEVGLKDKACWVGYLKDWEMRKDVSWRKSLFERSDQHPITCVSYEETVRYVEWLNKRLGTDAYRLPSEAEWEYAARAGSTTSYHTGTDITSEQAHFKDWEADSVDLATITTVEVGAKDAANAWGLRHMLGNVQEWTADCYLETHKDARLDAKPASEAEGGDCKSRALRGGGMLASKWALAVTRRYAEQVNDRLYFVGFRVVKDLD